MSTAQIEYVSVLTETYIQKSCFARTLVTTVNSAGRCRCIRRLGRYVTRAAGQTAHCLDNYPQRVNTTDLTVRETNLRSQQGWASF